MKTRLTQALLAALASGVVAGTASAGTPFSNWIGGSSGTFGNPANWDNGVPGPSVAGGWGVLPGPTVGFVQDRTVISLSAIEVSSPVTLDLEGNTLELTGNQFGGALSGLFDVEGGVGSVLNTPRIGQNSFVNIRDGVEVAGPALQIDGASVSVDGEGTSINLSGTLDIGNDFGGELFLRNGADVVAHTLGTGDVNSAATRFELDGAGTTGEFTTVSHNRGFDQDGGSFLVVKNGATLTSQDTTIGSFGRPSATVGAGSTWTNTGTFDVVSASLSLRGQIETPTMRLGREFEQSVVLFDAGGLVTGDVVIEQDGEGFFEISPAPASQGGFTVDGDFTVNIASPLLRGATGTTDFLFDIISLSNVDQMNVTGTATLSGDLFVAAADSLALEPGRVYTLISAGLITGTFNTINLPTLPGGFFFEYQQTSTTISVTVLPSPGAAGLLALGGLALARRRRG